MKTQIIIAACATILLSTSAFAAPAMRTETIVRMASQATRSSPGG